MISLQHRPYLHRPVLRARHELRAGLADPADGVDDVAVARVEVRRGGG